jgi:hypothetical protein
MTRRIKRARLPASGGKEIVFTQDDWKRIEQAYGHDLPLEVREYIRFVTYALSVVGNVERNAPALEKLKSQNEKAKRCGTITSEGSRLADADGNRYIN